MSQNQGKSEFGMGETLNLVCLPIYGLAWCFYPFFRCNMGMQAIGINGIFAMIVIVAYAVLAKCPLMLTHFFWIWLVAVILQRGRSAQLSYAGVIMHSRYRGDSLIMKMFPSIRNLKHAEFAEMMVCMIVGIVLCDYSVPLGAFIGLGYFAIGLVDGIEKQILKKRLETMSDAEIEQRQLLEQFRRRRNQH